MAIWVVGCCRRKHLPNCSDRPPISQLSEPRRHQPRPLHRGQRQARLGPSATSTARRRAALCTLEIRVTVGGWTLAKIAPTFVSPVLRQVKRQSHHVKLPCDTPRAVCRCSTDVSLWVVTCPYRHVNIFFDTGPLPLEVAGTLRKVAPNLRLCSNHVESAGVANGTRGHCWLTTT